MTCPACRGDFTQSLAADNQQCLECGAHFEVATGTVLTTSDPGGSPLPVPDPDAGPSSEPAPAEVPEAPVDQPAVIPDPDLAQ